jgi:hypothetical protein
MNILSMGKQLCAYISYTVCETGQARPAKALADARLDQSKDGPAGLIDFRRAKALPGCRLVGLIMVKVTKHALVR